MASEFSSELQALYNRVSLYSTDPEPIDDLKQILSKIKSFQQIVSEESKSILVNIFPLLVHFLLNNEKYASTESMSIASDIIDEYISLFPVLNTSSQYLEAFMECTWYSKFLYEKGLQYSKGGSWGVPPYEIADPLKDWRQALQEAQKIDAIKVDVLFDRKIWAKAKISKINEIGELVINFKNENSETSRILSKDSHEIAPYCTKTANENWRNKLDKGALVDACDTVGIWYHSTILDSRTQLQTKALHTMR